MTLVEAPESTKQLCNLLLNTSNVKRKGGVIDRDFRPIKALFMDGVFNILTLLAWLDCPSVVSLLFTTLVHHWSWFLLMP